MNFKDEEGRSLFFVLINLKVSAACVTHAALFVRLSVVFCFYKVSNKSPPDWEDLSSLFCSCKGIHLKEFTSVDWKVTSHMCGNIFAFTLKTQL